MNAALLYPFILLAGILQALGNSMNAQLRGHLVNPFLAASASFLPIVFVFTTLFLMMPTPLPSLDTLAAMPWYAPLGGVAGAVAVFGGLAFVDKVGVRTRTTTRRTITRRQDRYSAATRQDLPQMIARASREVLRVSRENHSIVMI